MKLHNLLLASAVVLGTALAVPANAADWLFSYTGNDGGTPVSASGVLTTDNTQPQLTYLGASGWGPNVYGMDVVSITGTRTEGAVSQQIAGLYGGSGFYQTVYPPISPPPGWQFDNVAYFTKGTTGVDLLGIEYAALSGDVTNLYNVYFQNGSYFENYVPLDSASLSPVPLPAALPMFGVVLAGLGAFAWYRGRATG